MTWRERIAEARKRGTFSDDDIAMWRDEQTCLVGEVRARYGRRPYLDAYAWGLHEFEDILPNKATQREVHQALITNNFDAVETWLERIEDRALELKRRMG